MLDNTYIECTKCKIAKHYKDFSVDNTRPTGRKTWCKICCIQHYQDSKEDKNTKKNIWRKKRAREHLCKIYEYLEENPCADCGEDNILTLEFDHVIGDKFSGVTVLAWKGRTWEIIQAEIDKCEVVCANCHSIRTAERKSSHRYEYLRHKTSQLKHK
jgi:hypothetical protein